MGSENSVDERSILARQEDILRQIGALKAELKIVNSALKALRQANGEARFNQDSKAVKLTDEQASAIIADARPAPEIVKEYGISIATVYAIKRGVSWRHLDRSKVVQYERPYRRKRRERG